MADKYEQDMKNNEEQVQLSSDKIKALTEKLDIAEQKLIEFASMPDIEEQLKDRMEALCQAQERQGTAEDRVQRLESQLEEKSTDLIKMTQRLKMNEEHNQRLSTTVDKLLSESTKKFCRNRILKLFSSILQLFVYYLQLLFMIYSCLFTFNSCCL